MPQIYQRTLFKLASREPPRTTLARGFLYRAGKILIYLNQNVITNYVSYGTLNGDDFIRIEQSFIH